MRVTPSQEVVRLVSLIARHADQVLVRSAARNAARSVEIRKIADLDDVHTLRDLEQIPVGPRPGDEQLDDADRRADRRATGNA